MAQIPRARRLFAAWSLPAAALCVAVVHPAAPSVRADEKRSAAAQARPAAALPLLLEEDFEQGAERWQPSDEKAWKLAPGKHGQAFSLFQQSKYKPPHRSPLNCALLKDVTVGDLTLEADVLSTVKDYNHRDMCLFFGYQDPAHFYYMHFGKKTDDHANQIFIVNDAPRRKISTTTTPGTPWDDQWRRVRLTRNVETGETAVYFDDLKTPATTATDKTFAWGQVGVGSFDDIGDWDNVKLWGEKVAPQPLQSPKSAGPSPQGNE